MGFPYPSMNGGRDLTRNGQDSMNFGQLGIASGAGGTAYLR
ncbi:MAG: hypothetical protein AAGN35_12735 [Bacteroidota bacterium]